jgi:hypothetical protein
MEQSQPEESVGESISAADMLQQSPTEQAQPEESVGDSRSAAEMLQQSPTEQETNYSGDFSVPMRKKGHDTTAASNLLVSEVQGHDAVVLVQNVLTHDLGTTVTHPATIQQLIGGGYQNPHNCCYYGASLQLLIRGMGKDNALRLMTQ